MMCPAEHLLMSKKNYFLVWKSGSFDMMENAFTVAVRCNICPVCKSAGMLEREPCQLQKTLLTQPRYIFVQVTFPIKLRCSSSKLLRQIWSTSQSVCAAVCLCFGAFLLTHNNLQPTAFSSGLVLGESSFLCSRSLVINSDYSIESDTDPLCAAP